MFFFFLPIPHESSPGHSSPEHSSPGHSSPGNSSPGHPSTGHPSSAQPASHLNQAQFQALRITVIRPSTQICGSSLYVIGPQATVVSWASVVGGPFNNVYQDIEFIAHPGFCGLRAFSEGLESLESTHLLRYLVEIQGILGGFTHKSLWGGQSLLLEISRADTPRLTPPVQKRCWCQERSYQRDLHGAVVLPPEHVYFLPPTPRGQDQVRQKSQNRKSLNLAFAGHF